MSRQGPPTDNRLLVAKSSTTHTFWTTLALRYSVFSNGYMQTSAERLVVKVFLGTVLVAVLASLALLGKSLVVLVLK